MQHQKLVLLDLIMQLRHCEQKKEQFLLHLRQLIVVSSNIVQAGIGELHLRKTDSNGVEIMLAVVNVPFICSQRRKSSICLNGNKWKNNCIWKSRGILSCVLTENIGGLNFPIPTCTMLDETTINCLKCNRNCSLFYSQCLNCINKSNNTSFQCCIRKKLLLKQLLPSLAQMSFQDYVQKKQETMYMLRDFKIYGTFTINEDKEIKVYLI